MKTRHLGKKNYVSFARRVGQVFLNWNKVAKNTKKDSTNGTFGSSHIYYENCGIKSKLLMFYTIYTECFELVACLSLHFLQSWKCNERHCD